MNMTENPPWYGRLYVQVLLAIAAGVATGHFFPETGTALKPLGDGFVQLIKMIIAPLVFCTVVHGVASLGDPRMVGRIGIKALVYFEIVSTFALVVGAIAAEIIQPGRGFNIDPATLDPNAIAGYVAHAKQQGVVAYLMAIVPDTFFGALASGNLLQVLVVAVLTGFAVGRMAGLREKATAAIDTIGKVFFGIVAIIVRLAPIGAFGAMAFTIGAYGLAALWNLLALVATFYATAAAFVLIVLGLIARACGFSILRFVAFIKDELLIVLGTSSSESVLPQMMTKMERLGASRPVVGLVIPTGYSFNLDGTNIYLTLATLFLAQATNTHLSLWQEATILLVAMLASKGASGVAGAGFVTLAATLAIVPDIPLQALAVLIGVDKFMSECRALTNLIGNGVATLVVSRWEGTLDRAKLDGAMAHPRAADALADG